MNKFRKPETKAIVSVDGERVNIISLKISQRMCQHHDCELVIDHKTFDEAFFNAPEKKLTLINEKVIIDLQPGDDIGKAYVFSGLVTSVRMLAKEGQHGAIQLFIKSNTIELERGKICQTYSNTNLYTIIKEITADTRNLSTINTPDYKSDIAFAIQYKETDFEFLARICHQYNVLYHYNGLDLIIGSYPEYPVVDLTYDMELRSLEVSSRLLANEESNYFYRREDHNTITQDSPKDIDGANYYLQQVSKQSDYLTRKRKPNAPIEAYVPDMESLINQMKRKKVATGAEMMYVKGEVKTCDVLIGRLVKIKMPKSMGETEIGTYRVYEVIHQIDQNGRYVCNFEAIPADLKYLPTREVKIPVINPIECECWRNEDPQGIGRVQVKFPFDERPCNFWIPTMTPSGGGNDKGLGPVNRGITMIPEISDSTLISFLDGATLSQPVVIGSMFHRDNSAERGFVKNNIKTIITRSNHMVKFDDTEKKESITIIDKNQNVIFIDTANNNITVTANNNMTLNATETMTLNARNLNINVGENMTTAIGDSQKTTIGKLQYTSSQDRIEMVEKSAKLDVGDKLTELTGSTDSIARRGDMVIKSAGKSLMQGTKDARISRG